MMVESKSSGSEVRIIYLEESPELVADLRDGLRAQTSWRVTHARDAAEALALAGEEEVDVALLSATMPDTDPIEVAEQLTAVHPKLTTFILAPDAESGGGLAFASGRFQWLVKPCNPAALVAAVERMDSLVSWMKNKATLAIVSGIHSLPTIPANYQSLIQLINSPDSSMQDVGEALSKDIGITSRILQVANSAQYAFSTKVTSPTDAVNLLGMETLKSLVLYSHVLNNFQHTPASKAEFDKIWLHSISVAQTAQNLTMQQTQERPLAEEAFTAGVLHDIGKLVLMSVKPEEYKEAIRFAAESKTKPHLCERVKLGTTHAETGAYLLSLWGIPRSILEAVAWHHIPSESAEKKFTALTAVHVANAMEHARKKTGAKPGADLDERYLEELGLTEQVKAWLESVEETGTRGDSGGTTKVTRAEAARPPQKDPPPKRWSLFSEK